MRSPLANRVFPRPTLLHTCTPASAPPFLSAAACASLEKLEQSPKLLQALMKNAQLLHKGLKGIPGTALLSPEPTPVIHLVLDPPPASYEDEAAAILTLARNLLLRGVGVTASKATLADDATEEDAFLRTSKARRDAVFAADR